MRTKVVLAACLLCLLPTWATAQSPVERDLFGVEFDLGSRLIHSGSFEAFSRNPAMAAVHLGGSWLPAGFERRLAVDARLGRSGSSARNFGLFEASLETTLLAAGASYRHPLLDRLVAVGRAGAGAEYVRVRLDDGAGAPFSGGAFSAVVEGTAGLEVVSPLLLAGSVERHIALRLEAGYGWRPFGADLDRLERRLEESDPARIASVPVEIGNLDLSGVVIRGSLAFRF
jgi:hypothetical protein